MEVFIPLENNETNKLKNINNLVYIDENNELIKTDVRFHAEIDELPQLPYEHLANFYSIDKYIVKTFMGNRTFSYHSAFGCPYKCSFCGVAVMFGPNWSAKSAEKMCEDIFAFKLMRLSSMIIIFLLHVPVFWNFVN